MKKILKTTLVAYIAYKILDFIIHGVILAKAYQKFVDAYRVDMMDYMWVFFVGPIIIIFLLTKLYNIIKAESKCMFMIIMPLIIMIPAAFYTWASIDISIGFTLSLFILGLIQVFVVTRIIMKMMGGCACKKCDAPKEKNA